MLWHFKDTVLYGHTNNVITPRYTYTCEFNNLLVGAQNN